MDRGPKISRMLMIPRPRISMKYRLRAGASPGEPAGPVPPDPDDVVGDELVAAGDELERALALADAAVADDQDAEAEDPEQAAGQGRPPGPGTGGAPAGLSRGLFFFIADDLDHVPGALPRQHPVGERLRPADELGDGGEDAEARARDRPGRKRPGRRDGTACRRGLRSPRPGGRCPGRAGDP